MIPIQNKRVALELAAKAWKELAISGANYKPEWTNVYTANCPVCHILAQELGRSSSESWFNCKNHCLIKWDWREEDILPNGKFVCHLDYWEWENARYAPINYRRRVASKIYQLIKKSIKELD